MKHLEKKLDENYTMMLHAVLNKSWEHYPTKQLYGGLPPISQTIQVKPARQTKGGKDKLLYMDTLILSDKIKSHSEIVTHYIYIYIIMSCR